MFKAWAKLFEQVTEFATELCPDRIINMTHPSDDVFGVVVVSYWKSA